MECIIISYNRLKYLKRTFESLVNNQYYDNVYSICDGGSTDGSIEYIKKLYNESLIQHYAVFKNNIGADVLKSYGMSHFVNNEIGFITSEDIIYPFEWDKHLLEFYNIISKKEKVYGIFGYLDVIKNKNIILFNGINKYKYKEMKWQPCGIINKNLIKNIGYFPRQYGIIGSGDHALFKRMRKQGYKSYIVSPPDIIHIGKNKIKDYPELYKVYLKYDKENFPKAINDTLANKDIPLSFFKPEEVK